MSFLELIKYVIIGIVQGVTKVLPVSSSGHVVLFQRLLGIDLDQSAVFLALMNLGSLIAVLFYFRKAIIKMIVDFYIYVFKKNRTEETVNNFNYVWKIIVASIPVALTGYYLQDVVAINLEKYALVFVGIGSLIGATFLYIVKDSASKHVNQSLSYKDALVIGLLQPFTVIPGLSRFAVTTSTGLMRKVSMDTALTFSMFLYIPISLGSILGYIAKGIIDPTQFSLGVSEWYHYLYYIVAFLTSIFATYCAIKWVFIYFRRGKLMIFAVYSMIVGFIALIFGLISY